MLDRLSDQPWEILENILGRLPIKDAAKTSILSKKWRYKWVNLSELVFDDNCRVTALIDWDQIARVVYNVLFAHRGQIDKFMLSTRSSGYARDLGKWIAFLSRNGVKQLILCLNYLDQYKLPSCLFYCQQLTCLSLTNCALVMPDKSDGFSNLVSLQLKGCMVYKEELENLISNCPIIATVVLLTNACNFDSLNIRAPNLKSLSIEDRFTMVNVENSPHLMIVSIKVSQNWRNDWASVLLLNFASELERLTLDGYHLRGIPFECVNLKVLELSPLHFDELDNISHFLSLLRCSPNLKALYITVCGPYQENVYKLMAAQNQLSYCFNQLQIMKMQISVVFWDETEPQLWRSDLEFIKLVLACSPVLEKMLVSYEHIEECDLWFLAKLISFERASSQLLFKYSSTRSEW